MKKGIFIKISEIIKTDVKNVENYDFIYFGSETCENLVLNYKKYLPKVFSFKKHVIISLPFLSERVLKYVKNIFLTLNKDFANQSFSFSINDIGTMYEIKKYFKDVEISVGRHLSKSIFPLLRHKFTCNSIGMVKFLKNFNVNTYEISMPNRNTYYDVEYFEKEEIKVNFRIHYPYVLLASARNCLIGFEDLVNSTTPFIVCDYSCLYGGYYIKFKDNKRLFVFENSIYKKNSVFLNPKKLNIESVIFSNRF